MGELLQQMDWQTHFFQSNTTIRDELASTPFVRHYMQEESLAAHPEGPKLDLPFNHLINQIVSQLSIANKLIATNSKLTTSLLENGRDIFLKKKQYFTQFCQENSIIGDALGLLPDDARLVFEYSAMALSNLILKLSINMAKISIVVVSRFLTPSYLNLFTVALLFEKYLELHLVRTKNFNSPEEHRHFLKQFPKISVIRLSKYRNRYDLNFFTRSQTEFNKYVGSPQRSTTKEKELPQVCNVQLIQFFEQEDETILITNPQGPIERHPRHAAFNLMQSFGVSAPFGFELLLLVSEIVIPKMVDFKPDVILFIEDFDDRPFIDPKVRGLIVNLLSEKVQHKMYVFREFGVTSGMKMEWLKEHHQEQEAPEFPYQFYQKISSSMSTSGSSFIDESDKHPERRESMRVCIDQNMRVTSGVFKKLQDHLKTEYRKGSILAGINPKETDPVFAEQLKNLHKNALQDLTYLSLALIQKSNFEETLNAYRNYIFPPKFLDLTMEWLEKELGIIENYRIFSQVGEGYKSKIEKLKGMYYLSVRNETQLELKQTKFYNFLTSREQSFKCHYFGQKNARILALAKEDSFYIAYIDNFILFFLFTDTKYGIYRKRKDQPHFIVVREQVYNQRNIGLSKKHSAFGANNRYFYKAFGQARQEELNNQSEIYRIQIEKPEQLQKKDWIKVASTCFAFTVADKDKKLPTIPLEFKRHGFGFSFDTEQNEKKVNITLFGGGYNFKIQNQQKINRFFYIIRDNSNEVYKIGKTNSDIVNQNQNMRNKVLIYPFVYGVPFFTTQNEMTVLNTNGYLENINNFKKLFLTKIKTGPMSGLSSIGIIAQNKMDYQTQSPEIAMANKNTILSYVVGSYHRVNRLGNKAALYNSEGELIVMECLKATEVDKFDILRVQPVVSREMSENEDTISVYFGSKKMIAK